MYLGPDFFDACARPGVPRGDEGARARAIRPEYQRVPPGYRFPFATARHAGEVYVVVRGEGG